MAQLADLVHPFLYVVFAKRGLACRVGLGHRFGAVGFGDCQQAHRLRVAAGRLARRIKAALQGVESLRDRCDGGHGADNEA